MYKKIIFFVLPILWILNSSFHFVENIKIGFLLDNYDRDRWYKDPDFFLDGEAWFKDVDFFSERIDELGGEAVVEVARGSSQRQYEQAQKLIKQGVKVLVIVPSNQDSAALIVDMAHKSGVKVIAYDRMINNSDVDYFIAYDTKKVGEYQANYMIKQKKKGNFVIINSPKNDINYNLYREGQMSVLKKYIDKQQIKVVLDTAVFQSTDLEAYLLMDDFLSKTQDIDGVIAANDALASGIIMALENHNLSGKLLITGQNADLGACRFIAQKKQSITIYKPIEALAYTTAAVAMKLAKNEPVTDILKNMATRMSWATKDGNTNCEIFNGLKKVTSILVTPILIDDKNLRETVVTDGHWSEEDIYK